MPTAPSAKLTKAATDTEQSIRERAPQRWEAEVRQESGVDDYLHLPRALFEDEGNSAYSPTQCRGNRNWAGRWLRAKRLKTGVRKSANQIILIFPPI